MKRLLMAIWIFFSGCASYPFQNWDMADTARQTAVTGLIAVDYFQTDRVIGKPGFTENNPLVNEDNYKYMIPLGSIAATIFAGCLRDPWRKIFQYSLGGIEIGVILHNEYGWKKSQKHR